MQVSVPPTTPTRDPLPQSPPRRETAARLGFASLLGWSVLLGGALLLWAAEIGTLWHVWRGDPSLSHGPLVILIALGLLWARRSELRQWNAASPSGLALLIFTALLYVGAVWADIDFLKPLSLLGMIAGGVWFLGGLQNLKVSLGAIGFLVFMIPWPTTVVDRLAFPLQLASSAYAALFAGILGIPIVRDGVHLAVQPNPDAPPIYNIVVAQQCSGLTSLMVLLALGYLIAYHTPVRFPWRALLLGIVVPLTLLTNATRLTVILFVGAHNGAALAKWIHDNESPVLLFMCSLALMGLRSLILTWAAPSEAKKDESLDAEEAQAPLPNEHLSGTIQ